MKKAYLIGQITVTNPEGYALYSAQVPQTIENFGGKYLVRGGQSTQLEGQAQGERNVVIEFPTREAAKAWYHSDQYQSILPHRLNNSTGSLAVVDGYQI
ncbi:MAG: DUF1330 domain-containing protein [Actinomycetales bacterium]|nr:DUF1330 domain-containing protein [Actinomycetales bacterium]